MHDELCDQIRLEPRGQVIAEDAPAPRKTLQVISRWDFECVRCAEDDVEACREKKKSPGSVGGTPSGHRHKGGGDGKAGVLIEHASAGVRLTIVGGGPFAIGDQ